MATRYTLTLPTPIYAELAEKAKHYDRSIKDVVSICLKFGLVALKLEEDPNSELFIREHVQEGEDEVTKETLIQMVW